MKVKNQKETKRDEFRKNKVSGHPAYIYKKVGRRYEFIGITHAEVTQGVKNIRLDQSPNPKDTQTSYIRPKSEQLKENKFSKQPYKGWKFTANDKKKVDAVKNKKRTK